MTLHSFRRCSWAAEQHFYTCAKHVRRRSSLVPVCVEAPYSSMQCCKRALPCCNNNDSDVGGGGGLYPQQQPSWSDKAPMSCVQAAAEVQQFVQEMYRCHKLPHNQKPSLQEWNDSPHEPRLQALQSFALDRAEASDSALAIQMMQVCSWWLHAHSYGYQTAVRWNGMLARIQHCLPMC